MHRTLLLHMNTYIQTCLLRSFTVFILIQKLYIIPGEAKLRAMELVVHHSTVVEL
jgi:hypothetical protein